MHAPNYQHKTKKRRVKMGILNLRCCTCHQVAMDHKDKDQDRGSHLDGKVKELLYDEENALRALHH